MALLRLQVTLNLPAGKTVLDHTWSWPESHAGQSSDSGVELQSFLGALCRLGTRSHGGSGLAHLGTLRMVTFNAPAIAMPQASDDTTLTLRPDDRLVCLYEEYDTVTGSCWVSDAAAEASTHSWPLQGAQYDALCSSARTALREVLEEVVNQQLTCLDQAAARDQLLLIAERAFDRM